MSIEIKPNHVTFFRMGAVPVIALLICMKSLVPSLLALVLFTLAALSDWLDGYLARKYHDGSLLGQVFDNVADKMLVISCLLALAVSNRLNGGLVLPALAIVLREIFITGLREYASRKAEAGGEQPADPTPLASSQLAKAKTVTQMVAIGFLISVPALMPLFVGMIGSFLLWVAAGLALYTGYQYWMEARFTPVKAEG
ncbi:MAG: CDP-diacylglycerol--glycerol-3-phosphate 3-phosphatidyltransferase [Proteobacteria bacterium]|nr:CDP-diacylglycerol--glycerol-3-phosphate 3-phosphatidyltransferase [Pseudomonadota bacterium]